jgi:hypothetical protein
MVGFLTGCLSWLSGYAGWQTKLTGWMEILAMVEGYIRYVGWYAVYVSRLWWILWLALLPLSADYAVCLC